jgi:hypothetical protein
MEPEDEKAARKEKLETQEKHAEIMRALWRHENDLLNTRLTLFIAMQALLFAGLGAAFQNKSGIMLDVLCVLGILVSISTAAVFSMGFDATGKLHDWWDNYLVDYKGPGITGMPMTANRISKWQNIKSALTPGNLLPKIFLTAWVLFACFLFKWHYLTELSSDIVNTAK